MNLGGDLSGCKHVDTECGDFCECWCDPCQAVYETRWAAEVGSKGLCLDCGFPVERPMTLAALEETRFTHFFMPCRACMDPYVDLMRELNRCIGCHQPVGQKKGLGCVLCDQTAAAAAAKSNSGHKSDEGGFGH